MTHNQLFLIQVTLSLGSSLLVIALLKTQLRDVLTEVCGTATRAAFWMSFTQLMLVIGPLLLVILFGDLKPGVSAYPAEEIKDGVFRSLFAIFIAIALIGRVIRKAVVIPPISSPIPGSQLPAPQAD
jgi:hypothetical protein